MLTIEGLIAVLSLCATFFGLGYAMGSHDRDNTKITAQPQKLSGYF